jgi:uncharacterized membrane protein HdeD (DUF308 family)
MTFDGDQPQDAEQSVAEPRAAYLGEAPASRDTWYWMQLSGLVCLAAGVAVLVVFALTLGGR